MSHADYAALPGINWSTLKHMRESPLAYRYALDNPAPSTLPQRVGRVTHVLTFEPELFATEYVIWTGGDRRGNEWKAFEAENATKTIFKPAEIEEAVAMANAVRSHPLVQPYLQGGIFESALQWTDRRTQLACKAKPDWVHYGKRALIDLKTAVTAEGRQFGRAAARYGYHCQLSHYCQGVAVALGWEPEEIMLVVVEKTPPYDVSVFVVEDDALVAGQEEVDELMARVLYCQRTGEWPGRYTSRQPLDLPPWVYADEEPLDLEVPQEE